MICVAVLTSIAGSFHFGFNLVLTNPSQEAFLSFMNNTLAKRFNGGLSDNALQNIWSFVVAILFLGALVGSFSIRLIADSVGRKKGLYISIAAGVLAGAMAIVSKFVFLFELYIVSRITMGWSVSVSLGLSALFLSEASPKQNRGAIGMMTGTCVQLGTVCGSVVAMPQIFGTEELWWLIYATEIGIMLFFGATLPFFPESPGFLIQRGATEAATKSIEFFYSCGREDAEFALNEIKAEQKNSSKKFSMMDVIRKKSLRSKAFIGVVVTFAMSFSGVAVINAFAFEILKDTGLSILEASLANDAIAVVSMISSIVAAFIVDRNGRRPLLLISFAGILFCNLIIFGLMFTFYKFGYHALGFILIAFICIFTFFFALGPGPLCYFINAELVGQAARSAAQSWASVIQMLSRFVLVTAFLPMKNQLGEAWSYLILFVAPVAVSLVYLYFSLPETKNKSPLEVEVEIENLPKFPLCGKSRSVQDRKLSEQMVISRQMQLIEDYGSIESLSHHL
uniref:MFS domain-containing protein n=1 Tax=Caenorhabditis japonica TaxID=281687 RepID=A0A8R1I2S9_CAEJA